MKVYFICRLFTGFRTAFEMKKWPPTGMPALFKLLETLNRKDAAEVIFIGFPDSNWLSGNHRFVELPNVNFRILRFRKFTGVNGIDRLFNLLLNCLWILCFLSWRQGVFYCDQANVKTAAFLCLLGKKVVLRMFGVASLCERLQKKGQFGLPSVAFRAYRANFKQVIFTCDGSPCELFASRYLRPNVPWLHILNGVDELQFTEKLKNSDDNLLRIVTIGRLEDSKGCRELVIALIELTEKYPEIQAKIRVSIVGDGELRQELQEKVATASLQQMIHFTGSVPHSEVYEYLLNSDLFVSMNKRGNMSNVVLEAMNAVICTAALDNDPLSGRDPQFKQQDFRDALFLLDPANVKKALQDLILQCLEDNNCLKQKKKLLTKLSQQHLRPWKQRVDEEIETLKNIHEERS